MTQQVTYGFSNDKFAVCFGYLLPNTSFTDANSTSAWTYILHGDAVGSSSAGNISFSALNLYDTSSQIGTTVTYTAGNLGVSWGCINPKTSTKYTVKIITLTPENNNQSVIAEANSTLFTFIEGGAVNGVQTKQDNIAAIATSKALNFTGENGIFALVTPA